MFTGLVQHLGEVVSIDKRSETALLKIKGTGFFKDVSLGDSICVNGACLSVVDLTGEMATFDVSYTTLEKSCLGGLKTGDKINLEKGLKVGARLDGHFVSGHVDQIGHVSAIDKKLEYSTISFRTGEQSRPYLLAQGSVSVDGISLTISAVSSDGFSVTVIPITLRDTALGLKAVGDPVNIEYDMIGKWVKHLMGFPDHKSGGLSVSDMIKAGF